MGGGGPAASGDWPRPTTKVEIDVVAYDVDLGVGTFWDEDSQLRVEVDRLGDEPLIVVTGNPAGLRSLARHLLTLAQNSVPDGRHLDFDWYVGLGAGSANLRIEVDKGGCRGASGSG